MYTTVLAVISLIVHGVTAESVNSKIIYGDKEDEITLWLPEHLLNQEEYIWKKGNEHIATGFGNGSLHIVQDMYMEKLSCAHGGPLIIRAQCWEDGDDYSVDISTTNKSHSSIHYHVVFQGHKFIHHDTGPTIVYATIGVSFILPLEYDKMEQSEIEEIDWLTEKWVYLAATNVDGNIRILEKKYEGSLSSTENGSLIFNELTKKNHGVYRACILSNKGKIVERKYRVDISDQNFEAHAEKRTSTESAKTNVLFIVIGLCIFIELLLVLIACVIYVYKRRKEDVETMPYLKEHTNTRKSPHKSDLVHQSQLPMLPSV